MPAYWASVRRLYDAPSAEEAARQLLHDLRHRMGAEQWLVDVTSPADGRCTTVTSHAAIAAQRSKPRVLSAEDVAAILRDLLGGRLQREVAADYQVSGATISRIATGNYPNRRAYQPVRPSAR